MPVAASFSRDFYERFGHEAVDELVTYLNAVDDAHRRDLREASDRSWERFDARLDQRTAELRADIANTRAQIMANVDARLAVTNAAIADLRDSLKDTRADMIKWMFVFMVTGVLAILGLG